MTDFKRAAIEAAIGHLDDMYYHINGHLLTDEEIDAYMQYEHSMLEWEWYSEHGKEVEKPNNEES